MKGLAGAFLDNARPERFSKVLNPDALRSIPATPVLPLILICAISV